MHLDLPDDLVERVRQRTTNGYGMSEADVVRNALDALDSLENSIPPPELGSTLDDLPMTMEEIVNGPSYSVEEARAMTKKNLGLTDL